MRHDFSWRGLGLTEMTEADEAQAQAVHDALQAHAHLDFEEGAVLIRWAVVADWLTSSGQRRLIRMKAPDAAPWERDGLFQAALGMGWEGLDGDWDDDDDEE
jgi:hypothetical protein